jgi:hypothetical protein
VRLAPARSASATLAGSSNFVQASGEHEFEPVHGLPAELPAGERVLWQGSPHWRLLAVQAFHVRKVAAYFGVLIAWRLITVLADGGELATALAALLWQLPLAAAGLGLLAGLAWLSARTTVYTLTNRRVVMRVGIVLSITFNLPLVRVENAAIARGAQGSGEICLQLGGPQRIAYLHLWPHVRPWQLKRTQPMLRGLAEVDLPAGLLAQTLRDLLTPEERAAAAATPAMARQERVGQAGSDPDTRHGTRGPVNLPLTA